MEPKGPSNQETKHLARAEISDSLPISRENCESPGRSGSVMASEVEKCSTCLIFLRGEALLFV